MRQSSGWFDADDGKRIFVYRFDPDPGVAPRALVHIAHGMAEHAGRYARFAEALTAAGCVVHAHDQRGHGRTAASPDELGSLGPKGGFRRAVRDLEQLIAREKAEHPALPCLLFAHSMGSYVAQAYLIEHGRELRGAIFSGSSGKPSAIAKAGRLIARVERLRLGPGGRSPLLHALSFETFNKPFAPARTPFDWLSRDPAEVDKYIADPLCGFRVTTQLWVDVLDAMSEIADPARQARVPSGLPIFIFAGIEDPVSEKTRSLQQLAVAYRHAGVRDVTTRYYPGGRHEMLNDTARDEVTRDVLAWIDRRIGASSGEARSAAGA